MIIIFVDNLTRGLHNFTLVVYDEAGNWATNTVWVEVIDTIPPTVTITSPTSTNYSTSTIMLRNYLITAIRNILRSKVFTLVNILGLTLGIACTLIIIMWIQDELSYDKYHEKADRIVHAYLRVNDQGRSSGSQPTTSHELAQALVEEIPEITIAARIGGVGEVGQFEGVVG